MTVVLVVHSERGPEGIMSLVTSHGVDLETGSVVILPTEHPRDLGAFVDPVIGEWVLPPETSPRQPTPIRPVFRTPQHIRAVQKRT